MKKLIIDYNGYIEISKDDIVIQRNNDDTGKMEKVDTTDLTEEDIVEACRAGVYYISLASCLNAALDGKDNLDISLDDGD